MLPGQSIFDAFERAAAASGTVITIVSSDFHRDHVCRLLLDELLMSGPVYTHASYNSRARRQEIIPIVRGECQLPFGITSAELLIRCDHDDAVLQPADMPRLRRLLKSSVLSLE